MDASAMERLLIELGVKEPPPALTMEENPEGVADKGVVNHAMRAFKRKAAMVSPRSGNTNTMLRNLEKQAELANAPSGPFAFASKKGEGAAAADGKPQSAAATPVAKAPAAQTSTPVPKQAMHRTVSTTGTPQAKEGGILRQESDTRTPAARMQRTTSFADPGNTPASGNHRAISLHPDTTPASRMQRSTSFANPLSERGQSEGPIDWDLDQASSYEAAIPEDQGKSL